MTTVMPRSEGQNAGTNGAATAVSAVGPSDLRADRISKAFQAGRVPAVSDVSLTVGAGEFVSLVGPSGCGKSTLFNILAGLIGPDEGRVMLGEGDVTGQTGHVGYMLQRDLLLPWRTVLDNVVLGQDVRGIPRTTSYAEARTLLGRFGLLQHEKLFPAALSGGMRQRSAMIRTILYGSPILLLDEPLSALDAQTRLLMQEWLLEVWSSLGSSVFYITHDLEEAIALADKVVVMTAGPGGTVKAVFPIDLPRPRVVQEIRFQKRFVDLYQQIWEALREEVDIAYSQTTSAESAA